MTDPAKPATTTVRFDPTIRQALDAFALRTHRSLNGAVNHLIARGLAEEQVDDSRRPARNR